MNSWYVVSNPNKAAIKVLLYQSRKNGWSFVKLRQISTSKSSFNASTESEAPKQRPKGSVGFKVFAFALTGFTLGLGYTMFNPDSRRQIEAMIPQSHSLFDYLDDMLGRQKQSAPSIESPKNSQITPFIEPTSRKATNNSEKPTQKASTATALDTQPESTPSNKQPEATPDRNLDLKNTLKKYELQEEATIDAIENKLRTLNANMKLRVSEALNSSYVAIESLNKYRQALRNALDDTKNEENKELQWRQVTDLHDMQTADVNESNQKFTVARKSIEDLDKLLSEVKSSDLNKSGAVKNLRDTQIDLINQYRALEAEQAKLSEAIIHANVLRSYTSEQKLARTQFLKEMQALQPDGIQGLKRTEDQLTNEEINSLLIHAHKRVLQLQKQIEKMQLTQNQQIQAALEEQRRQNIELQKQNETRLRDISQKEYQVEKEKLLEAERAKASEELGKELARQAAAHNNHLAQMLRIQQEELSALFQKQLIVEREKIRNEFYSKVSESLGRVKGIEHAINARLNLELQASNARQLWLAIQNLNEVLSLKADELKKANASVVNSEVADIKTNISTIKAAAPDNEFIQNIVSSVPTNALDNGVWTEPDLKERFQRLKNICIRVALIDERGGSLFKYFISYVQSFFIMHTKIDKSKLASVKLDELNLTTFNILDFAEHYLEDGNIELAIKLMQQLKGEPYRLAKDWIREAIVLLEIKQACNLLTAYISSIYIGTNLK